MSIKHMDYGTFCRLCGEAHDLAERAQSLDTFINNNPYHTDVKILKKQRTLMLEYLDILKTRITTEMGRW